MASHQEDRRNSRRAEILPIANDAILNGLNFQLWTGGGFKQASAAWHVGACIVFDQSTNWQNNLFNFGVSYVYLVPHQVKVLFASRPAYSAGDSKPNNCVLSISSGFLSSEFAERVIRELTQRLTVKYSATELIDVPMESWYKNKDDLVWLNIANDCNVEIVDELGRECSLHQEGEIRIRQKEIDVSSYMEDDEASRRCFRDGFFYPGDMAVKRADGHIRGLGRVDDVINLQGAKVAVAPIEQDLQRYLEADEVCLFVHLDDVGQEELIVAIQSSSAPPQAKLDHIRQSFPFFESVRFPVLSEFPRTESGAAKVRRVALKNFLTKGQ